MTEKGSNPRTHPAFDFIKESQNRGIFWFELGILFYMQHQMKLSSVPYNKIASRAKLIESRLYDEKRQQIALGDEIEFSENENPTNKVTTRVRGLLRYGSFKDLFADHAPALFGEESREFLLNQIKQFYSDEEEQKYGVLGIRLERID